MNGRTISHYEITEKVGEGGMGVVYKARDSHLRRFVALKVLPPEKVTDSERKQRFVQEARAASALNHPNIVTVYDIDQSDGIDFIAMEYVEGKTLDELIGRKGLKLNEALKYAIQIADALAKAHAAGIVHRDLKPGNVMVTPDGQAKVLDFGLAKLTETAPACLEDSTLTERQSTELGMVVGTPSCMSPEQAEGKKVDARSDIFSFGTLLYEMLTGRRPFRRDTPALTLAAILHLEPPVLPPEIPQELERVVTRCLRKDPARRFQHIDDVKILLEELKEESDSGARQTAAVRVKLTPRRWLFAVGTLAVLVVSGLGWWFTRSQRAAPEIQLARLTFDSGFTTAAAVSPDGKLVAYASDRSGEGNLDIWVQQVSGRQPIRLTRNGADNSTPSFSPDGSRIAFRSEREGGGIYVVDALGGPEQRIAGDGHFPRFSPDGSHIFFLRFAASSGMAKMFLVGSHGSAPQPFQPEFSTPLSADSMPSVAWSPDGKFLLFEGLRGGDAQTRDWWVAPALGGPAVRTGAIGALPKTNWLRFVCAWTGAYIYFLEGAMVESTDAYRVAIAPGTFAVKGPVEQLTRAGAPHVSLSIAGDGRMVLVRWEVLLNPWSVALDADRGTVSGEPQPLVRDSTLKSQPVCSRDGGKMAYVCWSGLRTQWRVEVRLRDLRSGQETVRAGGGESLAMSPRLNADGSMLAYSDSINAKRESYLVLASGDPQKICEGCTVADFFPDPRQLLVTSGPNQLARQDLETGQRIPVLTAPGPMADPDLSADGRWVTFVTRKPDGGAAVWIAPVKDPPAAVQDWIPIAEDRRLLNSPQWSPDGNLLYYVSHRDGWSCVWGQRLDPATKKPRDDAFAVLHSHRTPGFRGMPRSLRTVAVAADRLFFLFADVKGSLWTAKVDLK